MCSTRWRLQPNHPRGLAQIDVFVAFRHPGDAAPLNMPVSAVDLGSFAQYPTHTIQKYRRRRVATPPAPGPGHPAHQSVTRSSGRRPRAVEDALKKYGEVVPIVPFFSSLL